MPESEDTSTTPAADLATASPDEQAPPKKPARVRRKPAADGALPAATSSAKRTTAPTRRRTAKSPRTDESAQVENAASASPEPPPVPSEAPSSEQQTPKPTFDPQERVETRVLTSSEMSALEARTAAIFGKSAHEQNPAPETTPGTPQESDGEHAPRDEASSRHDASTSESTAPPLSQPAPSQEPFEPAAPQQREPSAPPQPQRQGPYPPRQPQQGFRRHYDQHGRRDRSSGPPFSGGDNRPSQQQGGNPRQDSPYASDGGGQGAPGGGGFASRPAEPQFAEGLIEVSGKGFGFLREAKRNYVQTPSDTFVTPEVCRRYNLRDGVFIKGEIRRSSRGPQLFRLTEIYGEDPEQFRNLPNFEELTTINPRQRIKLETVPERYTTRVMDLMTPIGKGQRGLIVAPPRTGKTTLLQHIAEAVVKNHPTMKLIILLVDERPEEVTEIRRAVPEADIMASSNDSDLKSHTRISTLAMDRAKRLVEAGKDVFILLDSITRVARAFNNAMGGGGRTGSGGLDVRAMEIPRKIFAAARNTEEAGSLTIMATALIETGSKMDEVIFQEFKGTGNMELVLDRKISDMRVYPAVDIFLSGTRREELLLQEWELHKINVIRRGLAGHKPIEAIERLLSILKKFPTNSQMLTSLPG